jgi:hydrogenase maturation protease
MGRRSARCVATDAPFLVIGYGNDLRSDDGAGRYVADGLEARRLPGVEVRSVSQLTPELALEVAGRRVVVFVDASIDEDTVIVRRIEGIPTGGKTMTHHGDPATLLSMVPAVGAPPAVAYVVSVPASDLSLGFEPTERTSAAIVEAVEVITGLLT